MLLSFSSVRDVALGSVFVLVTLTCSVEASPKYTLLHSFSGGSDGGNPEANLVLGASGNLIGTAGGGGSSAKGVLFTMTTKGAETVLHNFNGTPDGSLPFTGVVLDKGTGVITGTTHQGGTSNNCGTSGCGTIYQFAPDGTETILHSFNGKDDSKYPAGLGQFGSGDFYGAASGSAADYGLVFKLSAGGRFSVLHRFGGSDGADPISAPINDSQGDLFGATSAGGANGAGTIYQIAADGSFTSLYSFTGGTDGGQPSATLARDEKGNLYGTTTFGGTNNAGVAFVLTPAHKLTVLHVFGGSGDGVYPNALTIGKGGALYGTSASGGDPECNCGIIFKLKKDGSETVLHTFVGADGNNPLAGVTIGKKGVLYGTTLLGGDHSSGVVYQLTTK